MLNNNRFRSQFKDFHLVISPNTHNFLIQLNLLRQHQLETIVDFVFISLPR